MLHRVGLLIRSVISAAALVATVGGCASTPDSYYERHEIPSLTVVFMDDTHLGEKWAAMTGKSAVRLAPPSGYSQSMSVHTVKGFFDFATNTIYCPKMDFAVCGHELHHAVLGRFHPDH
jgi:hypothetical protein